MPRHRRRASPPPHARPRPPRPPHGLEPPHRRRPSHRPRRRRLCLFRPQLRLRHRPRDRRHSRLWPSDPRRPPQGKLVGRPIPPRALRPRRRPLPRSVPQHMILYPAMDLMAGRVVRLAQGRFDDATTYPADPAEALAAFAAAGATWAHVVDLDGARAGAPAQHDLIARLAAEAPLNLQVAGGIRTSEHIARLLDAGAARIVIGSLAVKDPPLVQGFLREFGDRITLSLDVRLLDGTPEVATAGWTEDSGR